MVNDKRGINTSAGSVASVSIQNIVLASQTSDHVRLSNFILLVMVNASSTFHITPLSL